MLFIFGLVVAVAMAYQLLNGCGSSGGSSVTTTTMDNLLQYKIYPDTADAPNLTFYWGNPRQTIVPPTVTDSGSLYGEWEGSGGGSFIYGHEPATETEMILSATREPIYSYCEGTIVYATREHTNAYGQWVGEITVRYGRKYAIKHMHVVDFSPSITVGITIEKGTLLAYTEKLGDGAGFWEVEMDHIKSSTECRAVPVVRYLDAASSQVFDDILVQISKSSWYCALTAPTTESWCSYVSTHEFWADAHKVGVRDDRTSNFGSIEQFCDEHGLGWIIVH
jgi:hypothetical protein